MNKRFIEAIIILSTLIFAISCDKQQEINDLPTVVKGLTIKASADNSSRTTFNGAETTWSANDQIKVLISGGNLASPRSEVFTLANASEGTFINDNVEIFTGTEYKFHAIYPATDITSVAKSVNLNIGAATQTQQGDSPAHIAALDPLYGCATATPDAVSIEMKHTAVALKLDLQNNSDNDIKIKKLLITAPTGVAIAGTYSVDIETGAITPSNENGATSRTIELTLNPAVTIAKNGKYPVWIATAPFTIEQGGSLLFTAIDTSDNEYDVIRSFVNGHTFTSGTISSTTLNITEQAISKQNMIVTLDFANANYLSPQSNVYEPVNNLLYNSGTDISRISAPKRCFYNKGVIFNEMGNDIYATITLPQITGYLIKNIVFYNGKNEDATIQATINLYDKVGQCKISNVSGKEYTGLIQSIVAPFDIVGITNDGQYYIRLHDQKKHHIKSWVITYQRMR